MKVGEVPPLTALQGGGTATKMPTPLIIGAGSGLVSAALFASAATATSLAGILFYLAPLPLCLAGLGWGGMAALLAALTGTVVVAASLGPATAAIFALS